MSSKSTSSHSIANQAASSSHAWRALGRCAQAVLTAGLLHSTCALVGCQGDVVNDSSVAVEVPTTKSPLWEATLAQGASTESAFAVELSTAVKAPETEGSSKQVHGYDLSGTWRLLPVDVDVEGQDHELERWLLARLQVDRFELGYEPTGILSKAEHEAHLRAQFQRAVLLEIGSNGEVRQVKAPADLTAVALGGLKALASHFQLAASGPAAGRGWQATELDTVGEYKAAYTQPSATELVRKKSSYLRLAKQNALQHLGNELPPAIQSEDRFTLDGQRRVTELKSRETLHFAASTMLPKLTSETTVSARRVNVSVETLRATDANALLTVPARAFFADPPEASRRFELDIAKVGDLRSVEEALNRFDALAAQSGPQAGALSRRLEISLGALLRLSPSAEEEAWSLLQGSATQGEVLRQALTQTPRAESQQRLVQLLHSDASLALEEQSRLLMALAENPLPSKPLLDALLELRKTTTLRDTVLMAIGGVCHEALVADPALSLQALSELEAELRDESAKAEKLAISLRALGNSGHPRVWDLTQPFLTHRSEVVRSAAIRALRRVEDTRVDAQIESMRTKDTSESVQKVALAIAEQRHQRELGRVR